MLTFGLTEFNFDILWWLFTEGKLEFKITSSDVIQRVIYFRHTTNVIARLIKNQYFKIFCLAPQNNGVFFDLRKSAILHLWPTPNPLCYTSDLLARGFTAAIWNFGRSARPPSLS